ncbi:uncharacterized protein LOC108118258 [Drosophila eugracilis]|uniref:uncharacterized protein LOC108118258 n=1 Tax=Drosophila eugracilis TaxID=29029 RepID=UPI0007E76BF3|nr:uncharacterized protein LOC108118258 [Drosophila eugracilis]
MQQSLRLELLWIAYGLILVVWGINGLNIPECGNQNGFINNTRSNCSYSYINCSGQDSMFCLDNRTCNVNYTCGDILTNTTAAPVTTTPIAITTTTTTTTPSPTASPSDIRRQCRQGVTKRFSYPQNCNYFYYCVDGFLLVEQCPIGYAFDSETGACGGLIRNSNDCTLK